MLAIRPPLALHCFLRQDIDQAFGRLASWISRHRHLEVPEQFVAAIQNFLNALQGRPWAESMERRAFMLNKVHDWNSWLNDLMTLHGHTGRRAPHVFRFQPIKNALSRAQVHLDYCGILLTADGAFARAYEDRIRNKLLLSFRVPWGRSRQRSWYRKGTRMAAAYYERFSF